MRALAALLAAVLVATPALAGPVELVDQPVDDDGVITLGELFHGAGDASDVRAGTRSGASAVLDAAQVQALARRHGLQWANATGVRRIIVRSGGSGAAPATATRGAATVEVLTYARSLAAGDVVQPEDVIWTEVQAHLAPSGAPDDAEDVIGLSARRPLRSGAVVRGSDLSEPQVIARGDLIEVVYRSGGISLSLRARAMANATRGETFNAQNIESGRTIQVVAAEPGRALAAVSAR
ncbi:flagellar basal body P-ring formation chaperone FlgA [Brevundimonas sp.]|uniref:flagellar basal body P-ring formation chaperone FlgA n=1 Tax=Brevundimonas sp. TaxID=1871086 RepID=UPI0025F826E2|nr:flagellar basal body P-ring formation chaperone FlgA [Brevundimonas sp.]